MKTRKALFPLILAGTVLLNSCAFIDLILDSPEVENKKTPTSSQSQNPNSYSSQNGNKSFSFKNVLPSETSLTFDDADNGKKLFVIYTNENQADLINERSVSTDYSSPKMTIHKGVTYMGHGIYRDEVHFDVTDQPIPVDARSARATAIYRNNNNDKFYAFTDSNKSYTRKQFELKVNNAKHCRIWFYDNNPAFVDKRILTNNEFKKLADNFDLIFEKETQIFGSNIISGYSNVITATEETKIDILVYDLFKDASEDQNSGTLGLFYSEDLLASGNQCEAIHVDSYFLQYDIKGSKNDKGQIVQTNMTTSTIVHEFQHLLNYCQKISNRGVSEWYNEMLSMCAEDIFEDVLNLEVHDTAKSRFNQGFNTPWQGFYNWPKSDDTEEEHNKILHAYANAYAFGAYLMRNYGGVELIHNICTNKTKDEDSITDALQLIEQYKDETFKTVLQKFGSVYILNTAGITLNKSVTTDFYGVKYTLSPINLEDYYFIVQNKGYNFNQYYAQGDIATGTLNGKEVQALFGPGILKPKSGHPFDHTIQSYGFVVYYLGTINSSMNYSVSEIKQKTVNNDNLTMSIVVID